MRASQNAPGGSSQLSMEVHQREDGKVEAKSPSIPWVGVVVENTRAEAIQTLRTKYQEWVMEGCRDGSHRG
jgi:hypothetical protein